MRAAQRILTGVFMVALLTTVFVATACGKDQAIIAGPAGADPTVVSTTGGTTTTVAPTTTTTVDPAALAAFYDAVAATTTTTAPPPPPVTQAPKPKVTSPPTTGRPTPPPAPAQQGSGACGGDLPPCYVMMRESGGNITAQNPSSSASGKWQFLDSTWQGYGGYAKASYAPESVQDAKARALWAGGRGCSHWSAC